MKHTSYEAPHYVIFCCYFLCLRSRHSPQHHFLIHPQFMKMCNLRPSQQWRFKLCCQVWSSETLVSYQVSAWHQNPEHVMKFI